MAGWEQQQQYGQYGPAGFGFVDSDGRGGEVGYAYANSKPGFVEVTEPTLPVGGGGRGEGELEKGPTEYCHAVYPKG